MSEIFSAKDIAPLTRGAGRTDAPHRRMAALSLLLAAGLMMTACSTDSATDKEAATYPSINSVPAKPDSAPSLADAKKIEEGLRADSKNAHYTEETLRADTDVAAPLATPKPAPEPQPKAEVTAPEKAPAVEAPKVAAVPAPEVAEKKMAEPAPKAPAEAPQKPAQAAASAPAATAAPAPAPAPVTTVVSGSGVEQVFQSQLAASSATQVSAATSDADMKAAPETDMSAQAPAAGTADGTSGQQVASLKPPAEEGRVIPNPAASDGSSPVETIYFTQGSHRISASDMKKLRHLALIREKTDGVIRIVGHASSRTREMPEAEHMLVNLNVSQARATAVASALLKLGVPAERLRIESVSDTEPLVSEAMTSLEAKNRRAEIFLLN